GCDSSGLRPRGGDGRRADCRTGRGGGRLPAPAPPHHPALRAGGRVRGRARAARGLRARARPHPAPDLPRRGHLQAAAGHRGAGNRGGLQHPGRAHRPHQGHPLRPADPGPDRRRCGRRPGASAGRRRACGGSALMDAFCINIAWYEIWLATLDSLLMLGGSLLFTVVFGLPLGVLLFLTGPRQLFDNKPLYALLSFVVNVLRSLPFIILLIVMIPITVVLTGTSLGVAGAIPPLVVGTT